MSARQLALSYIAKGWSPIPIPSREKAPVIKGWPSLRLTAENAAEYFPADDLNVGVLLGPSSGGLTDIDIDSSEVAALLRSDERLLPPTGAIFGRPSNPDSHRLYLTTGLDKRIAFADPTRSEAEGMLLEVRGGGGCQTVFPGSIHKSGEKIEWSAEGDPAPTNSEELIVRAQRLAALALLVRYWPRQGQRHLAAGAVAGTLGRISEKAGEYAAEIVELIAEVAGDDDVKDRRRAAEDAILGLKSGKRIPGLPKMREIFGDKVAGKFAEWMGYSDGGMLAEMNEQYFVIGGKVVVGTFKADATGNKNLSHYSFSAFKDLHDNIRIGEGKGVGKGTWWLSQRGRRQYQGIAFKALHKGEVADTSPMLNLWQGFGVQPVSGDWSLMQSHIRQVLANGQPDHETYILKWLAWAVQNPTQRAEVMLILKSEEEGTGKGALANQMVHIFGTGVHGVRIDKPNQLTGKHNSHLQRAALLYVDEAHWPGNKADEGAYKGLITEPFFAIEPKGVDIYFVPNCTHIICTSNNDWVAPAAATARRFAVFRVSPARMGDGEYFRALFRQMDNGGREAMLFDLLAMELGNWHPRNDIPQTDELAEQKLRSLDSELAWFVDLLNSGTLPGSGYPNIQVNECPSEWLFDSYVKHAGRTGKLHKSISTMLGTKLRKWLKDCRPVFRTRDGSYPQGGEGGGTKRGTIYCFPPLSTCRRTIADHLKIRSIPGDGPLEWIPSVEPQEVEQVAEVRPDDPSEPPIEMPF